MKNRIAVALLAVLIALGGAAPASAGIKWVDATKTATVQSSTLAAAPVRAEWFDSGPGCNRDGSYWTWFGSRIVKWTYAGYSGARPPAAHKHLWNGKIGGFGTTDYFYYPTTGWCADRH